MENTKKNSPGNMDQVISNSGATVPAQRAPGPSFKHQAGATVWFFKNGSGWLYRYDKSAKPQAQIIRKSQAPIFRKRQAS